MTNMILTMIGILLAGVAALMVTFYGGDAFFGGKYKAEASRLTVEGAQIEQALSNYKARYGTRPASAGNSNDAFNELMSKKFLASAPPGSNQPWVIDYGNNIIRSDVGPKEENDAQRICQEARAQQKLPARDEPYMCDGSDHPSGILPANEPCCIF